MEIRNAAGFRIDAPNRATRFHAADLETRRLFRSASMIDALLVFLIRLAPRYGNASPPWTEMWVGGTLNRGNPRFSRPRCRIFMRHFYRQLSMLIVHEDHAYESALRPSKLSLREPPTVSSARLPVRVLAAREVRDRSLHNLPCARSRRANLAEPAGKMKKKERKKGRSIGGGDAG
jgi:hypothetical protein